MGVIKITQTEFRKRLLKDQEHRKRMKLWRAGHTDSEIAVACGTYREVITDWRKTYKLLVNTVISGKGYKDKIANNRKFGGGQL